MNDGEWRRMVNVLPKPKGKRLQIYVQCYAGITVWNMWVSQLCLTKKGEGGNKLQLVGFPQKFHYPIMHFHILISVQTNDKLFINPWMCLLYGNATLVKFLILLATLQRPTPASKIWLITYETGTCYSSTNFVHFCVQPQGLWKSVGAEISLSTHD